MKNSCPSHYACMAALAIAMPLGLASGHAASAPSTLDADGAVLQQSHPRPVAWEEAKRRKLRHAYWLLEQADRDYHGHRARAIAEIKKAGALIGMDLHGAGYGGERQKWSDARLREARNLLAEVVDVTGVREHKHLRAAMHELDKALEVK